MQPGPRTRRRRPAGARHGGDATARKAAGARRQSRDALPRRHVAEQRCHPVRPGDSATPGCARPADRGGAPTPSIQAPIGTVKPCFASNGSAAGQVRSSHCAAAICRSGPAPSARRAGGRRPPPRRRRAAACGPHPVRHQAAVELQQQVVRQPVATSGACAACSRVRPGQAAAPRRRHAVRQRGRRSRSTSSRSKLPRARGASAQPPRPHSARGSGHSRRRSRRRPRPSAPPSRPVGAPGPGTRWEDRVVGGRVVHAPTISGRWRQNIRLGRPRRYVSRRRRRRGRAAACARSSAAPGASKPAVKAITGLSFSRAIRVGCRAVDAAREEHAIGHIAALVQHDALLQRGIQPGQRRFLARWPRGRPRAARRGGGVRVTAPSAITTVSPGRMRRMPSKIGLGTGGELDLQQLGRGLPGHWAPPARRRSAPAAPRRRRGRRPPRPGTVA